MNLDREERIRVRAYELWQAEGQPSDQQQRHWELATQQIDEEDRSGGTGGSDRLGDADGVIGAMLPR